MIQKLKTLMLSVSSLFLLAVPLAMATPAYADVSQDQINGNLCHGSDININGGSGCGNTSGAGDTLNSRIATVINIASAVVGVIAVIMIIIAGLRYVSSGGKEEGVKNAKNTILYAIIGLVIVALAQIVVHFVLNKATGTNS